MPLIHSKSNKALQQNMRTLHADIGKSPHVQSRKQAIAIALETQRRGKKGMASGGVSSAVTPSYFERQANRGLAKGMLHSSVPGRTDKLNIGVGSGSYVLPADHVSAMGQGNSTAGAKILQNLFSHATGMAAFNKFRNTGRKGQFAKGGMAAAHKGKPVPIVAAGGEFILTPEQVAHVGGGDVNKGHEILDKWVKLTRKKHIKTLRNLPGPKK